MILRRPVPASSRCSLPRFHVRRSARLGGLVGLLATAGVLGCGGASTGSSGTGGATQTGGSGTGGAVAGSGGSNGSGGAVVSGTGGAASGGSGSGTGGTGPSGTGGANATGGANSSGGQNASGGSANATGGSGAGGNTGAGSGGRAGTGGATATGGSSGTGGAAGASASGALHVEGRFLVDGDGKQVLFRGVELVHRWGVYSGLTSLGVDVPWEGGKNNNVGSATIREIGKAKGNAMRILGGIGNELDELLKTAIVEQKMFVSVARVDWTNAQMKSTLQKYAKYIILHPRGEFTHRDANMWRTEALKVVKEIRALGYTSPIEIGTTGYGQTWSTISMYGKEVAASDPLKNTLYLLQLYSEYAKTIPATLNEIVAFPYPVIVDACLFTSTYGNTPNTYKEVWDQTLPKNLSSFYWDWFGDGEGNSMTSSGTFASLNAIGQYIVNDSPAALKNTVKTPFLMNAAVP